MHSILEIKIIPYKLLFKFLELTSLCNLLSGQIDTIHGTLSSNISFV